MKKVLGPFKKIFCLSLEMAYFGGEYEVLVESCARWDHNKPQGNTCSHREVQILTLTWVVNV